MTDIKDVVVSSFTSNGVQTLFYAAGLYSADYNLSAVIVSGKVLVSVRDYTAQTDGGINLTAALPSGTSIVIYAFKEPGTYSAITGSDNITSMKQVVYVGDGVRRTFSIGSSPIANSNHCIVIVNRSIYRIAANYTITGNNVTFNFPPFKGSIIALVSFYSNKLTIGGVSPRDDVSLVTRTELVADGIRDTYTITGTTRNDSVYCLVFIDGKREEAGIDYIISHNRVKFNKIPIAGATLTFIGFGSPPSNIIPPTPYTRVRYLNKDANLNERTLYRNYWREQIAHFGMIVNYYTNLATPARIDHVYNESPLAGYSEPMQLNIGIKIDGESSLFSKFGLATDTDSTCIIHHDDFQEIYGRGSEPKAGDLIEFTEVGIDRLNYPARGPRIMEITEKNDEVYGEINNLAGHYVWHLKLKRFDYSHEKSMIPELGTKDALYTGETIPGIDDPIDALSKQIFDYTQNTCSNDRVYGDY